MTKIYHIWPYEINLLHNRKETSRSLSKKRTKTEGRNAAQLALLNVQFINDEQNLSITTNQKDCAIHPTVTQDHRFTNLGQLLFTICTLQTHNLEWSQRKRLVFIKKVWIEKGQRKALPENHARNTVKKNYCNTDASEIAYTCGLCGVAHNTGMIKVQRT